MENRKEIALPYTHRSGSKYMLLAQAVVFAVQHDVVFPPFSAARWERGLHKPTLGEQSGTLGEPTLSGFDRRAG